MRQKQRRDLSGNQIIQAEVFARRVTSAARTAEVPEGNWVPLWDGAEPPSVITDGAGNVIYAWYTP